ncbi:MAG: hypothetical protein M3P52_01095, partial [Actinomycetota bacterium]|nr:hypothetical protein [Actinomycetota bacterium]
AAFSINVFGALGTQLECSPQQPFGVAQPLFGLGHRGAKILPAGGYSQRADLGKLLPISLYVFGDD